MADTVLCIAAFLLSSAGTSNGQTLLLRYSFDEADSGSVVDAIDTGASPAANGVLQNAARTNDTPAGSSLGALNTTGSGTGNLRYLIATDNNGELDKLDNLESFTLTAWLNVQETPSGNRRLVAKQNIGPKYEGFSLNLSDSAAGGVRAANNFGLKLFIGGSGGFQYQTASAVTINADKQWVFVAMTYDGTWTSDNVVYYLGGVEAEASIQGIGSVPAGTTSGSAAAFGIGFTAALPSLSSGFPGFVDDVRVYSGLLPSAQIEAVRKENLPLEASIPVTLRSIARDEQGVTFSFEAQSDKLYDIEYKDSLEDTWHYLTTLPGALTVNVSDPTASGNCRFYRVITR